MAGVALGVMRILPSVDPFADGPTAADSTEFYRQLAQAELYVILILLALLAIWIVIAAGASARAAERQKLLERVWPEDEEGAGDREEAAE